MYKKGDSDVMEFNITQSDVSESDVNNRPESALKDALLEIISCMLSANCDIRTVAEERRKALELTDQYAINLMDILLKSDEALEERQMASILLKQFVKAHWYKGSLEFTPPLVADNIKNKIRSALPEGLEDVYSKIRSACSSILALIAVTDYPHDWPDMCDGTLLKIEYGGEAICEGVITYISDFYMFASVYQITIASKIVYPVLYNIVESHEKYSTALRGRAALLFSRYVEHHSIDKDQKEKLLSTVTNFCNMCCTQLAIPHPEKSDYLLRSQIIKCYSIVLNRLGSPLSASLFKTFPTVWQILYTCGTMYDDMLDKEMLPHRESTEPLDESPLFYILVHNIYQFFYGLLSYEQDISPISAILPDLLYYTITFMGLSIDMEHLWNTNEEVYLMEDYLETPIDMTMRNEAKKFLLLVSTKINSIMVMTSFNQAINKHMCLKTSKTESYYWRIEEATILAVGTLDMFVMRYHQDSGLLLFDIHDLLIKWSEEIVPSPSWFLLGRLMWIGGKFAVLLNSRCLQLYLLTTLHNLREIPYVLRYSAIRAMALHIGVADRSPNRGRYIELLQAIAIALMDALNNSDGEVVHIGLNAFSTLLKIRPLIDVIDNALLRLMNNIYMRNLTNPNIVTEFAPLIQQFCLCIELQNKLEYEFIPIISSIFNQVMTMPIEIGLPSYEAQCNAIELVSTIVKYSSLPLSRGLIEYGFLGVYNCIVAIDDRTIIEYAADCLRSFISKAASQMVEYRDTEGRTGLDYVLDVLQYVLDPNKMELACRQVARFCITVFDRFGNALGEHIDFLLKNMLSSLQRASTIEMERSLLLVFAYLFYHHLGETIGYLAAIPGPDGQSALAFVMDKWLSKKFDYGGKYQNNLNLLSLCKILDYTLNTQDKRLVEIKIRNVHSDYSIDVNISLPESTQSADYCEEIPLLVKILKTLIFALQNELYVDDIEEMADALKRCGVASSSDSKTTSGSSSGASTRREPVIMSTGSALSLLVNLDSATSSITDLLKCPSSDLSRSSTESEPESDDYISRVPDPLDAMDPIYNIKMADHLKTYFRTLSKHPNFMELVGFTDISEKQVLIKAKINISIEN